MNKTGMRSTRKSISRIQSGRLSSKSPGRLQSAKQLIRLFPAQRQPNTSLQQLAQRALEESRVTSMRPPPEFYVSPASGQPIPPELLSDILAQQLYPASPDTASLRAANKISANKVSLEYRGAVTNNQDDELERLVKRQRAEIFRDELEEQRRQAVTEKERLNQLRQEAERKEEENRLKMNQELERRKQEEDRRERERRMGRSVITDGFARWQADGLDAAKLKPAAIKEALIREAEIARVKMEFEKESAKIEIMRELQRRKPELRKYPEIITKRIEHFLEETVKKLELETKVGRESLDHVFHDIQESNRELILAKARAQLEMEKLKKEIFNIENNETLRLVNYLNTKRSEGKIPSQPLPAEIYYSEPVRMNPSSPQPYEDPLYGDQEPIFPMDLYSRRREMKGEYKIVEDGYMSAPNRDKFSFRDDYNLKDWYLDDTTSDLSYPKQDLREAQYFLGSDLPGHSSYMDGRGED